MEQIYLVELNIFKENAFYGLQKFHSIIFPETFISEVPSNFWAKNKCFPQILFPVRVILHSINFRCADFNTDSADVCILVMAYVHVDCACACT